MPFFTLHKSVFLLAPLPIFPLSSPLSASLLLITLFASPFSLHYFPFAPINVPLLLYTHTQSISVCVCAHHTSLLWGPCVPLFYVRLYESVRLGRLVCVCGSQCVCFPSQVFACSSASVLHVRACECVCWHKRLLCALGVNWLRSFVNILLASPLVRNRAGKLMSVWFSSRERERERERENE